MSATAPNTAGILDWVDYIQKFREFQKRFTDADGITVADVTDLIAYLATTIGLTNEAAALTKIVTAVKAYDWPTAVAAGGDFLKLIASHIAAQQQATPDPFRTLELAAPAGRPTALADACGKVADELEVVKAAGPPPETGGPIAVIAITVIGQMIAAFLKKRFGLSQP